MASTSTLLSFKEGIKALQYAEDFATLREIIDRMVGMCPSEDLPLAKDAIARVIRIKQANEINKYQSYPQAAEGLDKKYRDLYIVLRTAKSKVEPKALPESSAQTQTQIAKTTPFGGLNIPLMVLHWAKEKKNLLLTGGAVGGAYLIYKHFYKEKSEDAKKNPSTKENSLDKTIRSIQKYKAFTQIVNDPNFSGNYADLVNGNYKQKKGKKRKEDEELKSNSWDKNERNLMKNMDDAFNSLSIRPNLDYSLPQLPAPKNIDPKDIIDDSGPLSLKPKVTRKPPRKKRIKKVKESSRTDQEKTWSDSSENTDNEVDSADEVIREVKPKRRGRPRFSKPKVKPERRVRTEKPKKAKRKEPEIGQLIPIVKRTKRVKKVKT